MDRNLEPDAIAQLVVVTRAKGKETDSYKARLKEWAKNNNINSCEELFLFKRSYLLAIAPQSFSENQKNKQFLRLFQSEHKDIDKSEEITWKVACSYMNKIWSSVVSAMFSAVRYLICFTNFGE